MLHVADWEDIKAGKVRADMQDAYQKSAPIVLAIPARAVPVGTVIAR